MEPKNNEYMSDCDESILFTMSSFSAGFLFQVNIYIPQRYTFQINDWSFVIWNDWDEMR